MFPGYRAAQLRDDASPPYSQLFRPRGRLASCCAAYFREEGVHFPLQAMSLLREPVRVAQHQPRSSSDVTGGYRDGRDIR